MAPIAWAADETVTTRAGALAPQPIEQQVREQKGGEVVHGERALEPVGRDVARRPEPPDVVDQHVQPRVRLEHGRGEAPDLGLRGQVRDERVDVPIAGRVADLGDGRLGSIVVPAGDGDAASQRWRARWRSPCRCRQCRR